jgi:ABC-type branched-subunit amino acid transport system substrate-binding protein
VRKGFATVALFCMLPATAMAQVKIGLMVSATGPTSAIGIPQKNTAALLPSRIGDASVEYFQLEDGGDTTRAVQNAKKLIGENNVDALIGPSTTPNAFAILDIIAEAKVPLLATVGTQAIAEPVDAKKRWVFKTTQNDDLIAAALVKHMVKNGVKTVGFIGFNDPYGENWYKVFGALADKAGIRIVASERYARADQSVTGQSLKLIAARPDAVLIAAVGGPAVLPQATLYDQGYKGRIYQTHAVATDDFIRLGKGVYRGLRETVRSEAGNLRREHLRRGTHPATRDPAGVEVREARERSVPGRAARRHRAGTRRRRLPGRFQHERDESQRHGRARACAGDGQGRPVPAAAGITRWARPRSSACCSRPAPRHGSEATSSWRLCPTAPPWASPLCGV